MSEPKSYEAAREELAQIVGKLEGGNLTLADSLKLWQEGEQLTALCLKFLEGASAAVAAASGIENEEEATK